MTQLRHAFLFVLLGSGCSDWSPPGALPLPTCTPGQSQVCSGDATCSGTQVCQDDKTWGACECGDTGSPNTDTGTSVDTGTSTDTQPAGDTSPGTDTGTSTDTSGGTDTSASTDTGPVPTSLDMSEITFFDNPTDLASWPVTTHITLVEFGDNVHVEFSKQDGDDRWPDVTPPGWDGSLQYTLGIAERIDGVWYGSAAIQFWYGLYSSGGNVALDDQIAVNWYYDSRWGTLAGRQPATGEIIGVFVIAGNVRGVTDGSQSPAMERSDVVLVPFPDVSGATYSF